MFQGMNPQMLQMLMGQGGMQSGPSAMPQTQNMAPQLNMQQGQQRSSIAPMPQMPQQQPAIAPNGGILGVANNTGLTSMLGGGNSPTGFMGVGQNAQPGIFSNLLGSTNPNSPATWGANNVGQLATSGAMGPFPQQGFFSSLLGDSGAATGVGSGLSGLAGSASGDTGIAGAASAAYDALPAWATVAAMFA